MWGHPILAICVIFWRCCPMASHWQKLASNRPYRVNYHDKWLSLHLSFIGHWAENVALLTSSVEILHRTDNTFVALKSGGSVIAWGNQLGGGNYFDVQDQLVDVQRICTTRRAFALKTDGSVVA